MTTLEGDSWSLRGGGTRLLGTTLNGDRSCKQAETDLEDKDRSQESFNAFGGTFSWSSGEIWKEVAVPELNIFNIRTVQR